MSDSGQPGTELVLATFLDLVRIDSPSLEEAAIARFCDEYLRRLGFVVRFDETEQVTGSDTGNLIADLPGLACDSRLVLSAHMDCVEPCRGVVPEVVEGVVRAQGDTVLGADDKAGIAAILEACSAVVEAGGPRPAIRVVFTVQEEIGLRGAKALSCDDAQGDLCLVLDVNGAPGGIVVGAPTHYTFTARFEGRAAHAGVEPERGISAVWMAADAIVHMRLGRLDDRTTANVGSIHGGAATNVITATCDLTGECRSRDRAVVEQVRAEMHAAMHAAAERSGGRVTVEWTLEYEGFSRGAEDPAVELVSVACADVGLEARLFETGGGSDANIFASHDIPTLALSCGMEGVHGIGESVRVQHLEDARRLIVAVVDRMARVGAA